MKIIMWVFAVVGNLYFLMYMAGEEVVVQYAVGPLWFLMMLAPFVLAALVLMPLAKHLGIIGK